MKETTNFLAREKEQLREIVNEIVAEVIAEGHRVGFSSLSFRVLYVEPSKPREGWVVYADGTSWNPGSGKGIYVRKTSTWAFLG